ncbi:MAG: Na+/H+ antiporter subunit E [Pseudomonadota bacterium]
MTLRGILLGVVLFAFWLLLSGHYTPLLLGLGLLTCVLCVVLAHRMRTLDIEGFPIHLAFGAVTYFPWLVVEIAKSTLGVAGLILRGPQALSPNIITVRASQRSQVGINVYANSITLTPGTITVDVGDDVLTVHALTQRTAADLEEGVMDQRVRQLEGSD